MSYRELINPETGKVRPDYLMRLVHRQAKASLKRWKGKPWCQSYQAEFRDQLIRVWRTARDLEQEWKWLNGRAKEVPMSIVRCIGGIEQQGVRVSVWG